MPFKMPSTDQRYIQHLEALNRMGQIVTSSLELPEVLDKVINEVGLLLQAERVTILLCDGPALVFAAVSSTSTPGEGDQPDPMALRGQRLPLGTGVAGAVIRLRQAVRVPSEQWPLEIYRGVEQISGYHTRSLLAVPLIIADEVIGVMEAVHSLADQFNNADLQMLEAAGRWASIAIGNARHYQAEHDSRAWAEALSDVSFHLSAALDFDATLDHILEQIGRVVPYDTAELILVEGDRATVSRMRGYEQLAQHMAEAARQRSFAIAETFTFRRMAETGLPLVVSDTLHDPHWVRGEESPHVRSWAGAPIVTQPEGVIAFFSVHKAEPGFYKPEQAQRLSTFAGQAALALKNAQLYRAAVQTAQQLQGALKQEQFLRDQLIQSAKFGALGRLVASLAHEINNPLQAVHGCLSLLQEELKGQQRREKIERYLTVSGNEIERIMAIVRRMRDFYRSAPAALRPTSVVEVLEAVLELAQQQLAQAKIEVEREWVAPMPLIQANADHLKQVFLNLILNAIDAMPTGGQLRLRLRTDCLPLHSEMEHAAVRLEFSDTGVGISPDILPNLFEPFVTTKDHGSGLGLSISYQIVQAHNGRLTVVSQPGVGTTFTVLLPVQQPGDTQETEPSDGVGS